MCLSTVYRDTMTESNLLMKNVMKIECSDTCVTLTDLMDRTMTIEGRLLQANLVDGFVVIQSA